MPSNTKTELNDSPWWPYIRGTNKPYGTDDNGGFWGPNGYNCIEAGYIKIDAHNKVVDKIELTDCADIASMGSMTSLMYNSNLPNVTMDCVDEGYLRLFTREHERRLRWESERVPLSEMAIVYGIPLEERGENYEA